VSPQRLENIVSKLTEEQKSEKAVSGMMLQDVWKDFGKAEDKDVIGKANKLKSKVMPLMKDKCAKLYLESLAS